MDYTNKVIIDDLNERPSASTIFNGVSVAFEIEG